MNTISGLKPIIDALYAEMNEYRYKSEKRIKELEETIERLTEENKRLKIYPHVIDNDDTDEDDFFAEAALAPPASSRAPIVTQVETKNENNVKDSICQDDIKNIKMIGGKDAKEYMKEYQRTYRKKQKENTLTNKK
jgi:hypothetical protein